MHFSKNFALILALAAVCNTSHIKTVVPNERWATALSEFGEGRYNISRASFAYLTYSLSFKPIISPLIKEHLGIDPEYTDTYVARIAKELKWDPKKTLAVKKGFFCALGSFAAITNLENGVDWAPASAAALKAYMPPTDILRALRVPEIIKKPETINCSTFQAGDGACKVVLLAAMASQAIIFSAGWGTYYLLSTERGETFIRNVFLEENQPSEQTSTKDSCAKALANSSDQAATDTPQSTTEKLIAAKSPQEIEQAVEAKRVLLSRAAVLGSAVILCKVVPPIVDRLKHYTPGS